MARVLMKGCEAIAEALFVPAAVSLPAILLPPRTKFPSILPGRLPEVGGNFVQGESEVASINMVYGSASVGARSMTSSSSPGIALKSEGISYCAAARIPIVYANTSRGGPGVGSHSARPAGLFPGHQGFRQRRLRDDRSGSRHRAGSCGPDLQGL